ncbi:hypothetical protein [Ruegeria arenilitoris]|uniref:hypothetical protein n=1 Tax=Ruegeria arenilitoris TaxID=1173585 RepID=UPI00147CFA28|nr:hypothetical protein [Ruegeria arenilitoris]
MAKYFTAIASIAFVASVQATQAEEARASWHLPAGQVGIIYHGENNPGVTYRVCYTQGDATLIWVAPADLSNEPIDNWNGWDIELGSCSDIMFNASRLRILRQEGETDKSASGYYVRLD